MRFAIIGMGCRFPGGSNSLDEFFQNLQNKKDCVSEIPEERWNREHFFNKDKNTPGKMMVKRGGFMDHFFDFDPMSFQMSAKEASHIDPQQKILLEVTLQTLEDANVNYRGSQTGVFIGTGQVGFAKLATSDPHYINQYTASGSSMSIQPNMLSYKFDLRGPSMAIDTACSSSGTALYTALQSLRNGDCSQALVGGINMLLNHSMTIAFAKLGVLSPDGKCKSFDQSADGYVRSEGCGMVLVKPLDEALRDGDHIYGEIVDVGANEDGALSPSLTMPSAEAQELVMRQTLSRAEVDPNSVYYVEAHATGTVVGDSTEVNTIGRIFGSTRNSFLPQLRVGSVKSNIGHTECASFMASLIKCMLMLDRQTLVPSIHFKNPNPKIHFDEYNMRVQTEVEQFDAVNKVFSISSFGFGGANVCCLVRSFSEAREKFTLIPNPSLKAPSSKPLLFLASAQSQEALEARQIAYQQLSEQLPEAQTVLSYNLNTLKHSYNFLSYAVGHTLHNARFSPPIRVSDTKKKICFVFSGQGPQHLQMGRELYQTVPFFREALHRMNDLYKKKTGISVIDDLGLFGEKVGTEAEVQKIQNTLPALLFVQIAIYELWIALGVKPDLLIGHSFGELSAIYAAGCISIDDVIALTAARASLMTKLDNQGTMLAVGTSGENAAKLIAELQLENIWVAAYNSPQAVTLGGTHESVDKLHNRCVELGLFSRKLSVTNAYHTPLLKPLRQTAYQEFQSSVLAEPKAPTNIPIISTVTGKLQTENFSTEYFWSNIEQPVLFQQGIQSTKEMFPEGLVYLEISPHPVLGMSLKQLGCEEVLMSMKRGLPETPIIYDTCTKLKAFGQELNFDIFTPASCRILNLPTYPFQRKRCFSESVFHERERLAPERKGSPPSLLGRQMPTVEETWMCHMNLKTHQWLEDHVIQNSAIFPGAGYVELAMEALDQPGLENVCILQAMKLPDTEFKFVQTSISGSKQVKIFSSSDIQSWTLHAQARPCSSNINMTVPSLNELRERITDKVEHLYERFQLLDLNYGPKFRVLSEVFSADEEALGVFDTTLLTDELSSFFMHPAIIDNCFQCFLCCNPNLSRTYLPTYVDKIQILKPSLSNGSDHVPRFVYCQLKEIDEKQLSGDCIAYDANGEAVLMISGFQCKAIPRPRASAEKQLFTMQWQAKDLPQLSLPSHNSTESSSEQLRSRFSFYVNNAVAANPKVHPKKEKYWQWVQRSKTDAAIEGSATESTCIDVAGSNLTQYIASADNTERPINLSNNPDLKQTVSDFIAQGLSDICTRQLAGRIVRVGVVQKWLYDIIRSETHDLPNLDLFELIDSSDVHCDVIISFGVKDELSSVVNHHAHIIISPSSLDSYHYFAYPQDFDHVAPAVNASIVCGAYAVSMSQSAPTTASATFEDVIVYQQESTIPLLEQVKIMADKDKTSVLLIIVCNSQANPRSSTLIGFGRVIGNEYKSWTVRILDIDSSSDHDTWIQRVRENPMGFEHEVRIVNNQVLVPRLTHISHQNETSQQSTTYHLHVGQPGILNSLQWRAMPNILDESALTPNELLIEIHAASLNFKDMMLAQGMLKGLESSISLGLECSGRVLAKGSNVTRFNVGDEVFGFGEQCLSSHVVASESMIVRKPKNISHAEACCIPAVFVTAYFGLVYKAGLREGQSLLIHSAAGGIGQSAIQIAKWKKVSKILATVGSESKRTYLREKYGVEYFANSHTHEWPLEFAAQANGDHKMVDVVLNSLSGRHIELGIEMLHAYGSFVEIGKRDILDNNSIHLRPFLENLSFHSVHLDRMMKTRPEFVGQLLREIADRFEAGDFTPNVDRVFTCDEVESAFRYMQSGKHLGKIVIDMKTQVPQQIREPLDLFSKNKVYILSGGLGAVGFEIAKYMYTKGARHILLLSRSGRLKKQQAREIAQTKGAISVERADVINAHEVKRVMESQTLPIGGIIHLAMCLDDDRIAKLTPERFEYVLQPKVKGAENLIEACPQLEQVDFIIFFSSISSIIGNPEQANYAAANSFLELYAKNLREQRGVNARALNLGTVEDVGVIAQDYKLRRVLMTRGLLNQATTVREICEQFIPVLSQTNGVDQLVPEIDLRSVCEQHTNFKPVFGILAHGGLTDEEEGSDGSSGSELTEEVLKKTIGQLLQLNPDEMDMNEKLIVYGVDSLLAVEIATIMKKKFNIEVTQMDILGGITLRGLMESK